jgi:NADPH2:quinone reductase
LKAIRVERFGGPEVLRLVEVEEPVPHPGAVLIRVRAAGVNPVETYVRSGAYRALPDLPYTPGSDAGGEVVAGGDEAGLAPGTRIYTSGSITGTYAEYTLCRSEDVHLLPATLEAAQGAAVAVPYVAAQRAVFQRGNARAGERVLVHGASGAVGLAAVQFAVAAGARVAGTAGSERGRALVRAQGAEAVFDHHDAAHGDAVREWAEGGVDLVVEVLANVNLGLDLTLLAPRGRVVVVGSRGRVEVDPRDLMISDGSVLAVRPAATRDELAAAHAAIAAGLAAGELRPVVGSELPLADAPEAHRAVIEGPALGKIVLVP